MKYDYPFHCESQLHVDDAVERPILENSRYDEVTLPTHSFVLLVCSISALPPSDQSSRVTLLATNCSLGYASCGPSELTDPP